MFHLLFMERFFKIISFLAALFLAFLFGNIFSVNNQFFTKMVIETAEYVDAVEKQESLIREKPSDGQSKNFVIGKYDKEKAKKGYTVFSIDEEKAFLVDMQGNIVHQWSLPLYETGIRGERLDDPKGRSYHNNHYWRTTKLFPNGDLLAVYENTAMTPYGRGMVKIDKNSNLLWKYEGHAHHSIDISDENGDVMILTHEIDHDKHGLKNIRTPFIHDYVTILSREGKEKKRVSIIKAFLNSEYSSYLDMILNSTNDDITHTNSAKFISSKLAEKLDSVDKNDVLVSIREIDMLAILDVDEQKIKWISNGIWKRQHDPDILDDGDILLFDNIGAEASASRILKLDPETGRIKWYFKGTKENPFYTRKWGSQQMLENGNILITESENKRIFEINGSGEIVWDIKYVTKDNNALICDAERFKKEDLKFLKDVE